MTITDQCSYENHHFLEMNPWEFGYMIAKASVADRPEVPDFPGCKVNPYGANSKVYRAIVREIPLYVALNGFKVGKFCCEAPGTLLVLAPKVQEAVLKKKNIYLPPKLKEALEVFINHYSIPQYDIEHFLEMCKSFWDVSIGRINPQVLTNSSGTKGVGLWAKKDIFSLDLTLNFQLFLMVNRYEAQIEPEDDDDEVFIFRSSFESPLISGYTKYLEWLENDMPEALKSSWLAFMFEYVCGLDTVASLPVVPDEDFIPIICKTIKKICLFVVHNKEIFASGTKFFEAGDGIAVAYLLGDMLKDLIVMLSSRQSVLAQNLTDQRLILLIADVLPWLLRATDIISTCGGNTNLSYQPVIYKFIKESKTIKTGKKSSEINDTVFKIFRTCLKAQRIFIRDAMRSFYEVALKDRAACMRAFIKDYSYAPQLTTSAWEIWCKTVVEPCCQNENVIDRGCQVLSPTYFFGFLSGCFYAYSYYLKSQFLSKDQSLKEVLKKEADRFIDYDFVDTRLFFDEKTDPVKIPTFKKIDEDSNIEDNDYGRLQFKNRGDDLYHAQVYFSNRSFTNVHYDRPRDLWQDLFENKGGQAGQGLIVKVEELAQAIGIRRKITSAHARLLNQAADIWNWDIFPPAMFNLKRSFGADEVVIISKKTEPSFADSIQDSYTKYFKEFCFGFLFRISAAFSSFREIDEDCSSLKKEIKTDIQCFINGSTGTLELPEWFKSIVEDSSFDDKLEAYTQKYAQLLEEGGAKEADILLSVPLKELNKIDFLLDDYSKRTFYLYYLRHLMFIAADSHNLTAKVAQTFMALLNYMCNVKDWSPLVKIKPQEASHYLELAEGSTKDQTKYGIEILNKWFAAENLGLEFDLVKPKPTTRKKAGKDTAEIDAPVALNIDDNRLKDVLKTTAKARESLDRIFNEQEDDAEDAQVAAMAAGIRALRNADTSKSQTQAEAQSKKAATAASNSKSAQTSTASSKKGAPFSAAELEEIFTLLKAKDSWDESDLRRAYGKRSLLLGKFIDKVNEVSLELYDDYVFLSDDGVVDIETEYLDGVLAKMKEDLAK